MLAQAELFTQAALVSTAAAEAATWATYKALLESRPAGCPARAAACAAWVASTQAVTEALAVHSHELLNSPSETEGVASSAAQPAALPPQKASAAPGSAAHMLEALHAHALAQESAPVPGVWLSQTADGLCAAFSANPQRVIPLNPDTVQGIGAITRAYSLIPSPATKALAVTPPLPITAEYDTPGEAMRAALAALAIISQALIHGQPVAPHILAAAGHHMRESLQQITAMASARERLEVKDYLEQGHSYQSLPPIISGQQYIVALAQQHGRAA